MVKVIEKLSHWSIIVTSLLLTLFINIFLFPQYNIVYDDVVLKSLDLRLFYSSGEITDLFYKMGSSGMAVYRLMLSGLDMVYPIVYTTLLMSLIAFVVRKVRIRRPWEVWLIVLPLFILLFDYAENITIALLLRDYPEISDTTSSIASVMTSLKWIAFFLNISIILFYFGRSIKCVTKHR